MNHEDVVGKRCLIKLTNAYIAPVVEVKVLEVSPSGKRVKYQYLSGKRIWEETTEYEIIEVLGVDNEVY